MLPGETLLVLEAMKMFHDVKAPLSEELGYGGHDRVLRVASIYTSEGAMVENEQVLVTLEWRSRQ